MSTGEWIEQAEKRLDWLTREAAERRFDSHWGRRAIDATEALLAVRDRLLKLGNGVASTAASWWLDLSYLYYLDDDEGVYGYFQATPETLNGAVAFLEQVVGHPLLSDVAVGGVVHAAASPYTSEEEVFEALREIERSCPVHIRDATRELATRGLCNYGSTVGREVLASEAAHPWVDILSDALLRASVHRYSKHDTREAYERRATQLRTVFQAAVGVYDEDEVRELFSKSGVLRHPADGRPFGKHLEDLLLQLFAQAVRPPDRLRIEFGRLSQVRPEELGLQLAREVRSFDVFISHSSSDKPLARKLAAALRERGKQVWLDEWIMKPGDVLSQQISDGIDKCTYFVLLMSPSSLSRDWVRYELDLALARQVESPSRFIVPVVVDDAVPPASIRHLLYRRVPSSVSGAALAEQLMIPPQ